MCVCDTQYGRIPFKIAEGVELSVGVYNLIYPAKKPYAVQLETDSNQQVKTETNWVCADTGKTLLPHEIRTYHTFAQSKVIFTKDDMKEIKNFGEPCACTYALKSGLLLCCAVLCCTCDPPFAVFATAGRVCHGFVTPAFVGCAVAAIRLMGFKPKSVLKDEINLRSPYFLYPNEVWRGHRTVLRRLVSHACLHCGVVWCGMVWCGVVSASRMVSLVAPSRSEPCKRR